MRERITFVHGADDDFDPKQFQIQKDSLRVKALKGSREDRLTVSLYELPQELWRLLKQCHELRVRWISERPFPSIAPFVSTASPGLHILFTPLKDRSAYVSKASGLEVSLDLLCPLLLKAFGGKSKCTLPEVSLIENSYFGPRNAQNSKDTFIRLPILSERFASSATYQYHELLPSLKELVTYIQQKVCLKDEGCKAKAYALDSADYLDIDYDTISQSLVLSGFWHTNPDSGAWDEQISTWEGSMKVETAVLANEKPTWPEELSLGGFLAVLGEDSKPNPTLFSFPSRHHVSTLTSGRNYSATFMQPTGLHPVLRLTLAPFAKPPSSDCALHTYLTLPSSLFPDRYQLSSSNFLASNNLHAVRSISGESNLEAPIWAVPKWGSALLLEIAPPSQDARSWHADIPLHLRYLQADLGGELPVSIPWPIVFWACSSDEGTKMNTNPFDRVNLGYDGLFGSRTMFYHLQPASDSKPLVEKLQVPVLDIYDPKSKWVESGTMIAVLLGFMWVFWTLAQVARREFGHGSGDKTWKRD